jgi:outer membrane immunogenic protein
VKKLIATACFAIAAAAPAGAADLRMPVKAAPAPAVAMYNWSGFYIGGQVGYGWGQSDWEFINTPAANTFVDHQVRGVTGGGHAGVNWQLNQWVLGIEGSVNLSSIDGSSACPVGTFRCETDIDHFWRAGVRAGVATGPTGNVLLYGTGGFARANVESRTPLAATGAQPFEAAKTHHHGWYGGAGIEWGVTPNFTIGVEAFHVSLGNERHFEPLTAFVTRDIDLDFTVVQARASYKFNWGGPVVARY